ncbi:MAG: FliM/FliN family flagellar motor switch protein [Planctomycetes bacterium]|nr:FliM/FliN family flagellar motor switch protein [Planctomycetota bacterium]
MSADIHTILKLSVPVIVQVGEHHLQLDDVLALGPGAILELNKPAEDDLDLLVNNKKVGRGVVVKVGENWGIRINHIGSPRERVQAIASKEPAGQERVAQ